MLDYSKLEILLFIAPISQLSTFSYRSRIEQRELSEIEERSGASPPLELRRTTAMPLQSPGDRITGMTIL